MSNPSVSAAVIIAGGGAKCVHRYDKRADNFLAGVKLA
jgi:hypothetical protein